MKRMRLLALVGALAVFAAPAAYAQGGGGQGGQGRGGRGMEMLLQGVTLTDAQKQSVDSIQAAFRAKMPAMTPGQPMDSTARAQRMALMQDQYAAVRKVLTPEQQTTFDKNLADMRANMGRPRP